MTDQPLIYSCSGCSSAAQLANQLAIKMDRAGLAEMSCIAGLGGDVKPLVRLAKSGRPIVMLDGCPFQCGRRTLARHGIEPDLHWDLSRLGVSKEKHVDFDPEDERRLEPQLAAEIVERNLCPTDETRAGQVEAACRRSPHGASNGRPLAGWAAGTSDWNIRP